MITKVNKWLVENDIDGVLFKTSGPEIYVPLENGNDTSEEFLEDLIKLAQLADKEDDSESKEIYCISNLEGSRYGIAYLGKVEVIDTLPYKEKKENV